MKMFLGFLILLTGSVSFAKGDITCKGNQEFGTPETTVLYIKPEGEPVSTVKQNVQLPYSFVAYNGPTLIEKTTVNASVEDVVLSFQAATRDRVSGVIFLDELDQSSFIIGNEEMTFICEIR